VKRERTTEEACSFVIDQGIDDGGPDPASKTLNCSMAAAASTDWVSCHRASNQGDKGTIEALHSLHDDKLAEISKTHNNDIGAPRTTIANSGGGNFLPVPGPKKGIVKFLHQGLATTAHLLGGATILGFIQGNFSSSPFKAISSPAEAVLPIDQGRVVNRGKDAASAACPTLVAAAFGAKSEDEFAVPPGEVDTLAGQPNQLFIRPRIFTRPDGPGTFHQGGRSWDDEV
jgi:hypothetical protein